MSARSEGRNTYYVAVPSIGEIMDSQIAMILKAVDWNEVNVFLAVRGIGIEPNSKIASEVKLWIALL
ncbi:6962_t:CDS:2 [Gigaspora margarita]|uniref:6962_t:CDS:1 n=1 Tax=Gigaspora margarita TaxID=4874 RepID=A0ABM8VX82_GIGMA|nr:6962_t:CDS:2 [Gigaspora margarita]